MLKKLILESFYGKKLNCAFVIKNLQTGECALYNENLTVPSASLIKVPIMTAVMRQVKEGRLSFKQRITVKEEEKVAFSILTMLETGNSYSLNDLLTLMIVQSDNTAANILIDIAGMNEINQSCKDLNLANTVLQRKMMDANARQSGRENLTSASDMAWLLELLYRGEVLDPETSAFVITILKKQLDNTMMRLYIPDETVIAHKTGELDNLAHDAGIVYLESGAYIFVVLVWDAITNNYARETIGKISEITYNYFKNRGIPHST